MQNDYRPNFMSETGSASASNAVALVPVMPKQARPDRGSAQSRSGLPLLVQFTQATAKIMAEQRHDAAVVAVTQCLFELLQPLTLQHAYPLPESAPGQAGAIEVDDWVDKLKLAPANRQPRKPELLAATADMARQCVEAQQCQVSPVIDAAQIVAVPLLVPGGKAQAISAAIPQETMASALPLLSAFAGCLSVLQMDRQVQQGKQVANQFQALAKSNADLESAQNLAQAATHLTTRWAQQLSVTQIAWVSVRQNRAARVVAISGATEIDPASRAYFEFLQATQALLQADGSHGRWVAGQPAAPKFKQRQADESRTSGSPAERCLQGIASELMVSAVLAIPVRSSGQIVAYLFLTGPKEIAAPEWEEARRGPLDQIQTHTALAHRVHQTAWQRWIAGPSNFVRRWRWWLMAAALMLGAIAALPMPYTMYCDCELITTDRRYAVAPYKGTLKEVLVTPGAVVAPGDLLATMDDRELKIELAGKTAAFEREQNQIRISRATSDFAKARIAELEAARIQSEISLLQHHLSNREIRSPIAGTIVQGDLAELSGAPVDVGNNLFEIAGLDELLVQIEIPEYQYRYSTVGQPVRLSLEAFPYETFAGVIERLHPRATTRENRNIFLAEIRVPNSGRNLRPGMKGHARVVGDAYPLAWKWLHYPYEKTRQFLGWF